MTQFFKGSLKPFLYLFLLFHASCSIYAQDERVDIFELEKQFIQKLLEKGWKDWANEALVLIKKKYPNKKCELDYLQTIISIRGNQRDKAKVELKKIIKDFGDGCIFYIDILFQLEKLESDDKEKIKYLTKILEHFAGKSRVKSSNIGQFNRALAKVKRKAISSNNWEKAYELHKKYVPMLRKGRKLTKREDQFYQAFFMMEVVDNKLLKKPKSTPDEALMEKAMKVFEELIWVQDFHSLLAYLEVAHVNLLRGGKSESESILKSAFPGLKKVETDYFKRHKQVSPMAGLYYYYGWTKEVKSTDLWGKEDKEEDCKKYAIDAGKFYAKVVSDYNGSPFDIRAQKRLDAWNEKLKDRWSFTVTPERSADFWKNRFASIYNQSYKTKKYAKAAEGFMKMIEESKNREYRLKALKFAALSYCKLGNEDKKREKSAYYKALGVAGYAADIYPRESLAQDTLYNTGVYLKNASRKEGEATQLLFSDISSILYKRLLKINPLYPKGDDIAWSIAEAENKRAIYWNKEVQKRKKAGKTFSAVADARQNMIRAYKEAIPLYQIITENFGASKKGTLAFYRLGMTYRILGAATGNKDYALKSASNFIEYLNRQIVVTYPKIEAKFILGNQFYKSGEIDDAVKHFEEFLEWTEEAVLKKTKISKDRTKVDGSIFKLRQNIEALIPFSYDKQAKVYLDRVKILRKDLKKYTGTLKVLESTMKRQKEDQARAAKEPKKDGAKEEPKKDGADTAKVDIPKKDNAKDGDKDADKGDKSKEEPKKEEVVVDKGFEFGKLPEDYKLHPFINAAQDIDLIELTDEIQVFFIGDKFYVKSDIDLIIGLKGIGLTIANVDGKFTWAPTKVACYRNGYLIGIQDNEGKSFSKGEEADAPMELKTEISTTISEMEYLFIKTRATVRKAPIETEIAENLDKGLKIQDKALVGLSAFVGKHTKNNYRPLCLFKIGEIYLRRAIIFKNEKEKQSEMFNGAAKRLEELMKDHPESKEALKAPFQLFKAYSKTGKKDKASK
ncbi:MAG: hypothetical protein HRT89_06660, partial [Lentisphaeria bacterium]|nr:hypothetical protein [Lentisphaeria bacterium]